MTITHLAEGENVLLPIVQTTRKTTIYLSLLLFLLLITGCTDYKQLKVDMMQAVNKQEEIKSYAFTGSIELKADSSLLANTTPFAAALFALLKDSKMEYKGISSLELPSQMEAAFKVIPAGGTAIDIPILIKDSKLFFHIPALNKDDEYMVMPVENKQAPIAGSGTEALKNTGHLTTVVNGQLLQGIDPNWLQTSKDPISLADGTTVKRITLDINKKNETAFNEYWNQSVPGLTDLLKTNGLATVAAVDSWQTALKQVKFQAPSTMDLLIDNQGFIREQRWNLTFTANNSTNLNYLVWTQTLTDLNKAPAFTKDIPSKQKSLNELLKLVKPATAAKK
jgi:hypothetical protein